jgi:uncharacterized LabA/DUF88 family protein
MRSHCAVYVDAGYLLASAATRLTGTSLRSGVDVDHRRLIEAMVDQVETASGLPLLRVNWYDSARNGVPDAVQERIGLLPRVKVRLGRVSYSGEQKGVDLRIGLDMVAHARNGAVGLIYLVSGDDDLTEAVEEAQHHGVQVIVLAVPNESGQAHAVSRHLQRSADGLEVVDRTVLDAIVKRTVRGAPVGSSEAVGRAVVSDPPAVPSPAALAGRRRANGTAPVAPPTPTGPARVATSEVVYSSETGASSTVAPEYDKTPQEVTATIDQVAKKVLEAWLGSATPDQRHALRVARPSIPRELDRALLLDLSDALDVYDLSDPVRFELRDRFWARLDENVA